MLHAGLKAEHGMARLFISYPHLDELVAAGQVFLSGSQLIWTDGEPYQLSPAVYFVALVGAETDPSEMIGRVKTESQLEELRAEHYKDSVILGEVGYQVEEGFVGERG
jgi:hypothetical protein